MDDSRWLNRAVDEMNNRDDDDNNNNSPNNKRVDLTLKLGFSSFDFNQNTTLYQNTQQGVVNQGATVEGQESLNGSQTPFAWPSDQMESSLHNMNDANAFSPFAGSSLGFPSYGTTNFAPTRPLPPSPPPSPQAPATGYMLLDVPPRRAAANRQLELGSSSGRRVGIYNDPNRRCTNYNCKTNDTPMWRKGPLGPKTLCNACGIKYRKEEEKKAKEARGKGRGRRSNPNGN